MSRCRVVAVALFASLAFGAVAASSASAGEWWVNGTKLASSAALSEGVTLGTLWRILAPAVPFIVECEGPLLVLRAYLSPPNVILARNIHFNNCLVLQPPNCILVLPRFLTLGSHITADVVPGLSGLPVAELKTSEPDLFELEFEGADCSIAGVNPIKGEFTSSLPGIQTESQTHVLEGLDSVENNSLSFVKDKAYVLGGAELLTLASGSKWSFH
jgi:hypothetical protein